ncbi:MAG TPA: lamin tail domain-containing protein [Actinomycetes bacterium]|nr:lamin tail domain-containing protein [Actinomycetes bacterium]
MSRRIPIRALPLATVLGLLVAGVGATTLAANQAGAVSADIVISEVYGGGGNSGATFTNDFIELYNRGTTTVDISTWSVQYGSATGDTWLRTNLSGMIPPGHSYLIQEAAGAGGTTPLPTPDAVGSTAMSATAAKVVLVTHQTTLLCGISCGAADGIYDLVGYGSTANMFETARAPGLSNTTSASRDAVGTDTDNNAADFTAGAPNPQNCGQPCAPPPPPVKTINEIQGAAHVSPLAGLAVSDVHGIVTAKRGNGFWMQDPTPDADQATSDGLFVFTSSAPAVNVGDDVLVDGTVAEFRPGNDANNLTTTELTGPTVTVQATGAPVPVTLLGPGGRVAPTTVIEDDATGDVENSGVFDPADDGIDFYESLEGMHLEIQNAVAVGPRNGFAEIPVLPAGGTGAGVRTNRGGILLRSNDPNPERIHLDDGIPGATTPVMDVGDTIPGSLFGVLDYSFGNFKLMVTRTPTAQRNGLAREVTATGSHKELAIATFNVENLSPADPPSKFTELAGIIVNNLRAPGIVVVEEIQDNTGPVNDGTVAADQTFAQLIAAISAAGGPTYDWRSIDPVNNADGGQPGGNIRVGFLFRTDNPDLQFVDRPGGGSTTAVDVVEVDGQVQLTSSPGRIDPTNAAFNNSRKPLAAEFRFRGKTVFVVANHWNSKGGDDPLFGRFQPPVAVTETQRGQQATAVASFVDDVLGLDRNANIVIAGDLNDFDYSDAVGILTDTGMRDLPSTLPDGERYTYDFEGNSQVLDHILISPAMDKRGFAYDVVHVNSEFADQASDHEPQVARVKSK